MGLQLVIGNKNYSSWSMRAWVLMKQLGIDFDERKLRFDDGDADSAFHRAVAECSPAGLVPVLLDEGFAVWDTLAITEYLAERFPDRGVWSRDARRRARARSICAEMHAGFVALRTHCPLNVEATLADMGRRVWAEQTALRANVARIEQMWGEALADSGGPFLFGDFSAADAFYAPVALRLSGYALPVSATTLAYVDRIRAAPGVRRWIDDAVAEQDFLAFEEPYRTSR